MAFTSCKIDTSTRKKIQILKQGHDMNNTDEVFNYLLKVRSEYLTYLKETRQIFLDNKLNLLIPAIDDRIKQLER